MGAWRIGLAVVGLLLLAYGVVLLVTRVPLSSLVVVVVWLAAAILLHDAVWSPTLLGVGALLSRVPPRARTFLQGGLIVAGCVVVVAVPMIYVRGRQPVSKAILLQDVGANLVLLLMIITAVALVLWGRQVIIDRRHGASRHGATRHGASRHGASRHGSATP